MLIWTGVTSGFLRSARRDLDGKGMFLCWLAVKEELFYCQNKLEGFSFLCKTHHKLFFRQGAVMFSLDCTVNFSFPICLLTSIFLPKPYAYKGKTKQ